MFTQEMHWPRRAWWALVGLFVALAALSVLFERRRGSGKLLTLIAGGTSTASVLILWLFRTLHIVVSNDTLMMGFGPFREQIPVGHIVRCSTTTYRWAQWGGFGIRSGQLGKLYNVPGDRALAVEIDLADGRRIFFSSPDPAAVCRALRERRPEIAEE